MTSPDELETLTYYYDDSPWEGPDPRQGTSRTRRLRWPDFPSWPRRRRRGGQRRLRLRWPHPGRRLGDALVFLTSADSSQIGSKHERHRYATVGALMVLTAAQAWYSATLFFSIGLGRPFRSVFFFGIFFALVVVLIDRSIISYAAPIRKDKDENLRPPKKTNGVLFIRVVIAIAAALLMSEMILLQVFHDDISEQIQNDHLATTKVTTAGIEADYQARIAPLKAQITAAQNTVNQDNGTVSNDEKTVNADTQQANCQEFGCPGIAAGPGPGFRAAEKTLQGAQQTVQIDQQKLSAAQTHLSRVTTANQVQISQLNTEEQTAINQAQVPIANADQLLSQEEAFWQLTVTNGNVFAVRLLLSLLILGIDLAPLLTKLTGRTTVHDVRSYEGDYRLLEEQRHETSVTVDGYEKQAENSRQLHALEMGTKLFEAEQAAGVQRKKVQRSAEGEHAMADADAEYLLYWVRLEMNLRKLRYYHDYAAEKRRLTATDDPDARPARPWLWPRARSRPRPWRSAAPAAVTGRGGQGSIRLPRTADSGRGRR